MILAWLGGIVAAIAGITWGISNLEKDQIEIVSKVGSNLLLILIIGVFIAGALYQKINVYEAFIEGAKGGFEVTIKIIPYLVGMLVGIAVFRASLARFNQHGYS